MPSNEHDRWNRMSERMAGFHAWFKQEYNEVYELADGSFSRRRMSLPMYLRAARSLVTHLDFHHRIEETHIFPVLAKRMPAFAKNDQHIRSHRDIHKGLDALSALVNKYTADNSSYDPKEMRDCLDSFREVLFNHLDEEVEDLGVENMKKYWTLEEVDRLPM